MGRKPAVLPAYAEKKAPIAGGASEAVAALIYPDVWARKLSLFVDGHAFDVRGREYQIPILRDESPHIVIPKGAQLGLTTVFLIRTFHWITQRGWHHLYLLPLKTGTVAFVQGRIDPTLKSNPSLDAEFQTVQNRMHKQTRKAINLHIRGTNIWTELREVPSDVLVLDERDKMVEDNLPEAYARLDGSKIARVVELSTPTAPGHGVDSEDGWHSSDQHRWYIPCPHCSRFQVINFKESVVIGDAPEECYTRCVYCKKEITDEERWAANSFGRFEPENLNGTKRGYHISQLSSPTKTISAFMENYYAGQRSAKKMRAFFNNNLGEPYVSAGDQFTPELLDKCKEPGLTLGGIPNGPVYVGVDVGNVIHVRANYLDRYNRRIAWAFKIFNEWGELERWLESLPNFMAVCDAHPEKRAARDLSIRFGNRFWVGFEKDSPQQAETVIFSPRKAGEVGKVVIDRTMALDSVIHSYMNGNTLLPRDAEEIGENMPRLPYNGFYHQMCQMARTEEEDANGRIVARWKKTKNPDHWHHADLFCWAAEQQAPPLVVTEEMSNLFAASGAITR